MTDERPDLRALAEAATPGPWSPIPSDNPSWTAVAGPDGDALAVVHWNPGRDNDPDKDAAYIAAASPDRILALLDVVEAARQADAWVYGQELGSTWPSDLRTALSRLDAGSGS